jgi:hypothetical protein
MKKIIFTLLIMTGFVITANAQTRVQRHRVHERRPDRRELRRIRRIEHRHHRHRHHRMVFLPGHPIDSQGLVLFKTETSIA